MADDLTEARRQLAGRTASDAGEFELLLVDADQETTRSKEMHTAIKKRLDRRCEVEFRFKGL